MGIDATSLKPEPSRLGRKGFCVRSDVTSTEYILLFCAAHEERDSEQDECEVGYSPRIEEAQSGAPTRKKSHKERLSTVETYLDVLEVSLEELSQGQGRLLGVESSQ
ncbi:hypothetical protein BHE74_00004885 [Ensete ventricosum]|nr:hypothetical protein BHE74_00004885 [Ensete ventricosum]